MINLPKDEEDLTVSGLSVCIRPCPRSCMRIPSFILAAMGCRSYHLRVQKRELKRREVKPRVQGFPALHAGACVHWSDGACIWMACS